jgi:hypothetical protein
MPAIPVTISRFVDEHQPGFVECVLTDAFGQQHLFVEKVPVVTLEDLWSTSTYPRPGELACEIEAEWQDTEGRFLVRVNTERPCGIESTVGMTNFVLVSSQVLRDERQV